MNKKYKLIMLDRDGVINEDSAEYIKSPEEWLPVKGSLEAIAKINQAGCKIVVVTNQSGIARGYFTEETLRLMHEKMRRELAKFGGSIDDVCYCPHHPDENCACRKPKPKMVLDILQKFQIQPQDVLFVGDAWVDFQLAKNVGCDFVLVKTGKGIKTIAEHKKELDKTPVFDNLAEVVKDLFKHAANIQ
jgi:D-glycero-D-manno-heptose 1,7-bisphosphate phosphatase